MQRLVVPFAGFSHWFGALAVVLLWGWTGGAMVGAVVVASVVVAVVLSTAAPTVADLDGGPNTIGGRVRAYCDEHDVAAGWNADKNEDERPFCDLRQVAAKAMELKDTRPEDAATVGALLAPIRSRDFFGRLLEGEGMRIGAEVGVQRGMFTQQLLGQWHKAELFFAIDMWDLAGTDDSGPGEYSDTARLDALGQHVNYKATASALAPFGSKVVLVRNTSVKAAQDIPDGLLDFVYIDGACSSGCQWYCRSCSVRTNLDRWFDITFCGAAAHDYTSVAMDIEAFYNKVRPGGIIAGDDFVDAERAAQRLHPALRDVQDWSIQPNGTKRVDGKAVRSAVIDTVMKTYGHQVLVTYDDSRMPSWYFRR